MEPAELHQPARHGLQRHLRCPAGKLQPIGTIFSALFISHISVGGTFLSTKYYPTEISDLISGIIIYLCAFSMLFRGKIHALLFKNADKTNVNAEPAAPAKSATEKEGK